MPENSRSLPSGWYAPKLSELGSISTGSTPSTSDQSNYQGELPFVGPSNLKSSRWIDTVSERLTKKGEVQSRTVERNAVLVSCIGILGKLGQAKEKIAFNQQINALQPCEEKIDPDFLYYACTRLSSRLNQLAGLQVVPIVKKSLFSDLQIFVPVLLKEQKLIAEILDTLDTQIHKTEELIAKLEKVKEGLLHDLLTRGIDDNGRLRPSPEQAPNLYKESPWGVVLHEWHSGYISDFCKIENQLRQPISAEVRESMPGVYPYYGPTGIIDRINEYRLEGKFALIGEDGDHFLKFSRIRMTQLVEGRFNVNNHAHVVSGSSRCLTEWFEVFFRHKDIALHLTRQGAGRFKLNKFALMNMPISVPTIPEQERIINKISLFESSISHEKFYLNKVKKEKAGLMDDLLAGRVRVTPLLDQAQATTPA